MDVKVLKKSDRRIKFSVSGIDTGLANAIRRIAKNEVPVMAIEEVDFEQNSSGMYDEMLAHRLGLVPFVFDPKIYNPGRRSPESHVTLEAEGPVVVRAGDIKGADVWPLDANIPVVELLEGQKLKLQAKLTLGYGKDHAKWQAAHVGYQNVPSVRVSSEKADPKIVALCPTNVFEKKDGRVRVAREEDCILCMRCVEVSEGVTVRAEEDAFIFDLESVSGISAASVLEQTLDIIDERADEFKKGLKQELK